MGQETRERVFAKIGYSDWWPDYGGLEIERGDGSVRQFETRAAETVRIW